MLDVTKNTNIAFCGYHGWHDWYVSSNLTSKKSLDGHLIEGINVKVNSFINTSFLLNIMTLKD